MSLFISEDDINQTVKIIIESLPSDTEGFRQASQIYDSDFFKGEDPVFTRKLASALQRKYKDVFNNAYWDKLAGE